MIPTKTKMWTKFFFWLECWCVSQNNKRHFFDNQRKKNTSKKKLFCYFCSSPPTGFLHSGSKKHYPSLWNYLFLWFFFRINAAKFWKCYRFQCFGFFWKYFFAIVEKRKWQWKKKMRNKSTFYNGGVFVRMWWWCYMML